MVITLKLVVPFKPARRFSDHGISLRLATNAAGVESSVSMSTAVASKLQNYVRETCLFSSSDVVFSAASCSPDLQKAQPRVLFPVSNFGWAELGPLVTQPLVPLTKFHPSEWIDFAEGCLHILISILWSTFWQGFTMGYVLASVQLLFPWGQLSRILTEPVFIHWLWMCTSRMS